jgi:hypothetical protein
MEFSADIAMTKYLSVIEYGSWKAHNRYNRLPSKHFYFRIAAAKFQLHCHNGKPVFKEITVHVRHRVLAPVVQSWRRQFCANQPGWRGTLNAAGPDASDA